MSLGSEASSLRASIRAALLQKMSCLYEGGGAEGDRPVLAGGVCLFSSGAGVALDRIVGLKREHKRMLTML